MDFDISLLRSKTWLRGLGPAKAVDVEVESKIEQLQVVGNSSENLTKDCEYQLLLSKVCFVTFKLLFYS